MKLQTFALVCWAGTVSAFSAAPPRAAFLVTSQARGGNAAVHQQLRAVEKADEQLSMDEEVELLVQEEKDKTMLMAKMSNGKGMEYAPWMNVSPEDEARIRQIAREKTKARRQRQEQQQNVSGDLLKDSTNQELSGTGLRSKIIGGDSVELEWATGSEKNTKGFLVKRRPTKTTDFAVLASYETYGPIASKGANGGVYRYLDENVGIGNWVYRITECDTDGQENDLSQCLVEIQTAAEQKGQALALAGFGVIAVAALAAGLFLDPVQ